MAGNETSYIADAMKSGQIAGDQGFGRKCQALLERRLGVAHALLTTSCTHALEMCALLLDIKPGDEVIVPSFTFVSTVNAFMLRGATPVFSDVRPDTLNLDESKLERLITPKTRAIVVVHYAGVACEMQAIMRIAEKHGVPVIEDNAHGLFGAYQGRPLGSLGALATQSFHETKNYTCGEGGALLVNEKKYHERAEILREKGTNRSRFFRGQIDKYTWVDLGSSYVISDLLAAFLLGQLEQEHQIQGKRQVLWDRYHRELASWAANNGVTRPTVPVGCQQSYHMYYLLMPSLAVRTEFIDTLKKQGILSVFHYLPLHLSDMGKKYGGKPGQFPVTEDVSDRLVRLPFYNTMTAEEQDLVVEAVTSFRSKVAG